MVMPFDTEWEQEEIASEIAAMRQRKELDITVKDAIAWLRKRSDGANVSMAISIFEDAIRQMSK